MLLKVLRSCPWLRGLSHFIRGGPLIDLLFSALFLLTSGRRMLKRGFLDRLRSKRGFLDRLRSKRGCLCLGEDPQGWRKDDSFGFPHLRRSFNPSLIESFFLSLSAVSPAHRGDLCLKSILGLSYANVVAVLFSLIPFLLGFNLVLLSLRFGFFSLILKFISLF